MQATTIHAMMEAKVMLMRKVRGIMKSVNGLPENGYQIVKPSDLRIVGVTRKLPLIVVAASIEAV